MQHLGQQNAGPQQPDGSSIRESPHPGSGYNTVYNSPGSGHWDRDGTGSGYPAAGVPYEYTDHSDSSYPNPYGYAGVHSQPYGRASSTTPAGSDYGGGNSSTAKRTTPKATKATRSKKAKKPTKQPKSLTLPGPITDLGKDSIIPLFDIEAYIQRPIEERRREVGASNGKIKRPMNSYIMYRKVYQERVKEYSKETNHQSISRLVSSSWLQETTELKDKFADYASIERENLMKAFPDYKFQPKAKLAKKRKGDGFSGDEPSDLNDSDPDWGTPRNRRSRAKQPRRSDQRSAFGDEDFFASRESSYGPWDEGYQQAAYPGPNPGRPPPAPMAMPNGGYYHPQMVPHGLPHGAPLSYYDPALESDAFDPMLNARVSGLPGMPDALLNSHDGAVDPMLGESWIGGAFTADQFHEYNQYPDLGAPQGYERDEGASQQPQQPQVTGPSSGQLQGEELESLLRANMAS